MQKLSRDSSSAIVPLRSRVQTLAYVDRYSENGTETVPVLHLANSPRPAVQFVATGGFSMDIKFKCDGCGQDIVIDETGAGQLVNCPKCKNSVMVPVSSGVGGKIPVIARSNTAVSRVVVEKIEGTPLPVVIVGVRLSRGEVWDITSKVLGCLFVFGLLGAIITFLLMQIIH